MSSDRLYGLCRDCSGAQPLTAPLHCAAAAGGNALAAITIVALFFVGVSSLTVTTRIAYAMARDGALPGSTALRYVWPVSLSPVWTVALVFMIDALLMLLPLVNTSALNAILSISVLCYQVRHP